MAEGRRIPPPIIHIPPSKIKITTPQLAPPVQYTVGNGTSIDIAKYTNAPPVNYTLVSNGTSNDIAKAVPQNFYDTIGM